MKKLIVALLVTFLYQSFCFSQTLVPISPSVRAPLMAEGVTVYGVNDYTAYDTALLSVTKLIMSGSTELRGVEYLLNLDSIEISGSTLTTLSPLSNLVKLKKIKVYNCDMSAVTDFSFLNNLPMLVYVQFLNCKISEINNMSLSNADSIDMEFDYNVLDNEDIQSFYNVPKFRYLNIYGSNIGAEQQYFSPEVIRKLMVAKPGLGVRYRRTPDRAIPISGTDFTANAYYIMFTECDTLGPDHYFLKYDVRYGNLSFPEGAELLRENYIWHVIPKQGIIVSDEAGKQKEMGYSGVKLRSDKDGVLTPSGLRSSPLSLYGFGISVGSVTYAGSQFFTFADFPYPFSEIIDYYLDWAEAQEIPIPTAIRGSIYYNENVNPHCRPNTLFLLK